MGLDVLAREDAQNILRAAAHMRVAFTDGEWAILLAALDQLAQRPKRPAQADRQPKRYPPPEWGDGDSWSH